MKCYVILVILSMLWYAGHGQIAWTPIFVDGSSQVDLWTQSSTGCTCPGGSSEDCACCVREGACPCGEIAPTRCTQCGLEQHCANMCNITIDSRILKARSGKTFGQIKSPSLTGPDMCSYLLQPDTGQRVEIQVYRMVAVGRFNGTSCVGGYLQLLDGAGATRSAETRLCGVNERYTPPVVLFADHGASTLIFKITENTGRSQFLAYFSFTSLSNTQGVGFHPKGGSRIPNTDCDWLYQDTACSDPDSCVLASPGYPGLYPPLRKCRYLLTTSSVHTKIKIIFSSIMLPENHCTTDYLSLRDGSTPNSPLLATLCTENKATLEHPGPNLLLEFNSGSQVPPFNYNGFIAKLEFVDNIAVVTTQPPKTFVSDDTVQQLAALMDSTTSPSTIVGRWSCGARIRGFGPDAVRSGHFDTRLAPWRNLCVIEFIGLPTDVVHVSLFNFNLRSSSCRSVIEVREGTWNGGGTTDGTNSAMRVCGTSSHTARAPAGTFTARRSLLSRTANITLLLRRPSAHSDDDFVDGAFMFHDERHSGTASPTELCGSAYYGAYSLIEGTITAPQHHHLFWNHEGRLVCSHRFIPGANQSVTIQIESLDKLSSSESTIEDPTLINQVSQLTDRSCWTVCGDNGCMCMSKGNLSSHDHLAIIAEDGNYLSCLCGDFKAQWLPVSVRSWTPIRLQYSVAHYTYTSRGFDFTASYHFHQDSGCGQRTFITHSGEISSQNITLSEFMNSFYYQQCTWILDSNVDRQLYVDVTTTQDRKCSAWNVSVHEWITSAVKQSSGDDTDIIEGLQRHAGKTLHTFCPRHRTAQYELPWRLNTVVIRAIGLSRQHPEYSIRWKSQVVRANTRLLGPPTASPNASKASSSLPNNMYILYILMFHRILDIVTILINGIISCVGLSENRAISRILFVKTQ